MIDLKGKKIIVTGASKGLGAVAAPVLAKAGAHLVLIARDLEKLSTVKSACDNSHYHLCLSMDFFDLANISQSILKAIDFLGQVDCVLHVAGGGLGFRSEILEHAELTKLFNLNIAAAAEINRLVIPKMRQQKSGNLVHVGSIASFEAAGSVGYNTVKAALAAYVRSLGREVAGDGIIATGIMPGGFLAPENAMERLKNNKPEVYENFIKDRLPRKRMGLAEEIMPLLTFLCSNQAGMMSGCMVPIDAAEGRSY